LTIFFYGVFARFSARGVQKHYKLLTNPRQNPFVYKKVDGGKNLFAVISPSIYLSHFWPFLCMPHEELKNTMYIFFLRPLKKCIFFPKSSKIIPKALKKPQKIKRAGTRGGVEKK
jgi:hypothetical protein